MVEAFPYIVKVKFAINVCDGASRCRPLPRFVCFGGRGEVGGNRFKRGVEDVAPYRDLFVYVIEVRCIFSLPLEGKVDATKEQTDEVLQTVFTDKL